MDTPEPNTPADTAPDGDLPQRLATFYDACTQAFQDAARAMHELVAALAAGPAGKP